MQQRLCDEVGDSAISRHLIQMPPMCRLGHPLIRAFDDQFSGEDDGDHLRQSIKSVKDRQWLKQTFGTRWRGAAVILADEDGVETVWLGAAGYHRAGSPEDFYARFSVDCAAGSDGFLPREEDRVLRAVENKVARLGAWKLQLHLTSLLLLHSALQAEEVPYTVDVRSPDGSELLQMEMTVVSSMLRGAIVKELLVVLSPSGWEKATLREIASRVVCTAIDPNMEAWKDAPLDGPAMSHWTAITESAISQARAAAESGEIHEDARPGEVRLGTIAHYAPRDSLTRSTVEGEAVRAMCGHWFVPTADHEHLPRCATCHDNYEKLPT
ncbi:DUF3039 domain-containing protein [Microbacterium oryzae]|uniref:DUF3039 domain-containing protein n=1 Tax=Microbacterium oryzae TaxID=743009 RepID=UPI0025AEDB79|nr:DUF3039 domain-containing protein [Microbacterium oryzae]MDN3310431.1 DUF3039 domain-containing protein [Microbacterium oryzae]